MDVKYNASSTRRSTSTTTAWTWSALLTCEWRVAHRDTLSVKAPRARHANRIHPHPARIATRDATPAVGSGPASPSNPHPTNLDAFPSRFTSPLPHLVIFLLLPTPPPPDPANRETNHPRISLSLSLFVELLLLRCCCRPWLRRRRGEAGLEVEERRRRTSSMSSTRCPQGTARTSEPSTCR